MTVGSQVKQTVASLKGTKATLETFALLEQDEKQKEILKHNIAQINDVIENMEKRLGNLEYEEPQYKGF